MQEPARLRWRTTGLLLTAALVWLLALMPAAQGAMGFSRMEFLAVTEGADDPSALMMKEGWSPFDGTLALGYRTTPIWIRAWLDGHGAPRDGDHFVRIGMAYLDDVRLYGPSPDGSWHEFRQGDQRSMLDRVRRDRLFLFEAPAGRDQPILIRVVSTSTLSISVEHLTEDELLQVALLEHVLLGGLVGLWTLLLLWSASNAWVYRDRISAWFCLYQLSSVLMGISLSGYSAVILPADFSHVSELTSATVLLSSIPAIMFHRNLSMELRIPRLLIRVLDLALLVALFDLGLAAAGHEQLALQTNATMIVAFMGLYLPVMFLLSLKPAESQNSAVLLAYGLLGLFILYSMLPVLGLAAPGIVGLYGTVLHSALTGILLGGLLLFRHARLVRESKAIEQQALATALENRTIRAERDDKERLLSMLAHELRTPLSVLRMAVDSGLDPQRADQGAVISRRLLEHGRQAIRDMNEVIERTVQADRLERGLLTPRNVPCDLGEVLALVRYEHHDAQRLDIESGLDLGVIQSDPLLLKTILLNLVDNALKYSPPSSRVRVVIESAWQGGTSGARVRVLNQPGIAGLPDPERVFRKYYRSEGAHRATGSGLGLYIVSALARQLSGQVSLRPDVLEGWVCFEMWLPA